MPRKKLQRFEEVHDSPHIIEYSHDKILPAIKEFISDKNKIILEIGCGRGEYTTALAQKNTKNGYIGLDIQGERLWFGSQKIKEYGILNALFVRGFADHVVEYFPKNSIDEIWLTFPDPFVKESDERKRLMSPQFIEKYQIICKDRWKLHIKTDSTQLFNYAHETLEKEQIICSYYENIDTLKEDGIHDDLKIKTQFEKKFRKKNIPIKYVQCEITS